MDTPEHEHDDDTLTEPAPDADPDQDEDDENAQDEDEPDAPPDEAPQAQGLTEDDVKRIEKSLDGLKKHVSRRLGEILGEMASGYVECEMCSTFDTPGWRPDIELPEEVAAAVRGVLGENALAELRDDPHSRTCPECAGLGQTLTGSKVPEWYAITCAKCQGRGWEATDATRQYGGVTVANGALPEGEIAHAGPPMSPTPENVPPEADALRARGFIVIPPAIPAG